MPFWLFISINWIVHRIGWSEPSEALKVTWSGNLPEVQTSSSASQEIATSHQKLLCNSASIISECPLLCNFQRVEAPSTEKHRHPRKLAAFGLASESNAVKDLRHICGWLDAFLNKGNNRAKKKLQKLMQKMGRKKHEMPR